METPNFDTKVFKPKPGVFNNRQLAEILYSLEGKKEIPGKYVYFASGVNNWASRSTAIREGLYLKNNTEKPDINPNRYKLVDDTLGLVLGSLEFYNKVNIVDVGPGTGYPVIPIITALKERGQMGKYISIDIVKEMTDLAIKNITDQKIITKEETVQYVHDFEDGHFADLVVDQREPKTVNLLCFFGSTLGNMISRHRALANLRDSMTEGDLLWIGNTLYNSADYLVESYGKLEVNSEKYLSIHRAEGSFFESFGMDNWGDYGRILVEKDDALGLVKFNFLITKTFAIELPKIKSTDEIATINLEVGDKITFQRLKNYNEADLISELKEAGLKIKMMNVADDYRSALVLVSV